MQVRVQAYNAKGSGSKRIYWLNTSPGGMGIRV